MLYYGWLRLKWLDYRFSKLQSFITPTLIGTQITMNKNLTQNLTTPIIIKITGAFVVLSLMIVSLAIFSIVNINEVKNAGIKAQEAEDQHQAATAIYNDVLDEQNNYLLSLENNLTSDNYKKYVQNFNNDVNPLIGQAPLIMQILPSHTILVNLISSAMTNLKAGNLTQARATQSEVEKLSSNLLDLINQVSQQKSNQALAARQKAINGSNGSSGFMLLLAFITLMLTGIIVWFVIVKVLAPLRLLNERLTQLLWGQTEHLTERLNLLQYESANYNEMLTAVRHDLKSPLSSIKGLAELSLILHPELEGELLENLTGIIEVSDSSVTLISSILARRETRLDLCEVNVGELVDKVLQLVDLRYYTVQRKVEITEAVIDPGLMEHALLNLISNARKFSAGGMGVGVQRIRKPGTADTQEIEFWVWNDGAVINGEQKNEIFKPGVQTEEGKQVGGHGLGLAIVKNIAELHHGRVSVDSHIKVGTTFRITIPTLEANPITTKVITPPAIGGVAVRQMSEALTSSSQ